MVKRNLKEKENIDYIRIEFSENFPRDNVELLKAYYQSNGNVKLKMSKSKANKLQVNTTNNDIYDKYSYMFDNNLSPYDILTRYINEQENSVIVTGDQIKELIAEV